MKPLSLLCRTALAAFGLVSQLFAEPRPHPTRTDRLVDDRDGFTVEYSPGQEAYVEAVFAAVPAWTAKATAWSNRFSGDSVAAPLPCDAKDLLANRDPILGEIAGEIGLAGPTALQGRVFDTMLTHYATLDFLADITQLAGVFMARCDSVQIWDKSELRRRLMGGESLDGFSWDEQTHSGTFQTKVPEYQLQAKPDEVAKDFEEVKLDHAFNYKPIGDGVVVLSASFTFGKDAKAQPLRPPAKPIDWEALRRGVRERIDATRPTPLPLVLSEKTKGQAPAEVALTPFSMLEHTMIESGSVARLRRNPPLLHTILHEAVEVGLVENFIGSADRRWLCDGVANYVAWKIVRDRAGAEVAKQAYDLDAQLAQYAGFQKQIDLRRWRAVENTKDEERETDLTKAHYAFATRAVFEIVRRNGEDFLPILFAEVAKTPRHKVRMSTVEKAYRKLTGKKLADVTKAAETTPVPGA